MPAESGRGQAAAPPARLEPQPRGPKLDRGASRLPAFVPEIPMALTASRYGKERVRVMRLARDGDHHTPREMTLSVMLTGRLRRGLDRGRQPRLHRHRQHEEHRQRHGRPQPRRSMRRDS